MEKVGEIILLFLFSVFAGTMRFLHKELDKITFTAISINAGVSLLSGMLVFFLTYDIPFMATHLSFQAGIIGLAGYTAPETLKLISTKFVERVKVK